MTGVVCKDFRQCKIYIQSTSSWQQNKYPRRGYYANTIPTLSTTNVNHLYSTPREDTLRDLSSPGGGRLCSFWCVKFNCIDFIQVKITRELQFMKTLFQAEYLNAQGEVDEEMGIGRVIQIFEGDFVTLWDGIDIPTMTEAKNLRWIDDSDDENESETALEDAEFREKTIKLLERITEIATQEKSENSEAIIAELARFGTENFTERDNDQGHLFDDEFDQENEVRPVEVVEEENLGYEEIEGNTGRPTREGNEDINGVEIVDRETKTTNENNASL